MNSAAPYSHRMSGGIRQTGMKVPISAARFWIVAPLVLSLAFVDAAERTDAKAVLQETGMFALGGIGVAGTMSEGERALREILKNADATTELEKMLTSASPAGQLYSLLGLRLRDRSAYQRALEKVRATDAKVQTARGCILQQESFRALVKQIELGNYDTFLAREWPEQAR
jgi:hypothetical protein